MYATIVLIGPMAAGKSTIAALLAEKLNMPRFGVDEHRWTYYEKSGYDSAHADHLYKTAGGAALLQYWKPFEADAVVQMLKDQPDCVMDFGAGHSVYEDEGLFAKVAQALAPYPNVILLLPSPDLEKSAEICNARFLAQMAEEGQTVDQQTLEMNAHFVKHPSNHKLARITVYSEDKTPEETADELITKLQQV